METGRALKGDAQTGRIPIVMSRESFTDPYYHAKIGGDAYRRPQRADIDFPIFRPGQIGIFGQPFCEGQLHQYGQFDITPYIWYHGKLADGVSDDRRTLAYLIRRRGRSHRLSKTFITTGYCERPQHAREINQEIHCHHMIFAYSGGSLPAKSARKIMLMPNSPVGANYIFAGHTDKNSRVAFDAEDDREKVSRLFSHLLSNGLVTIKNGSTYWRKEKRPILLGYWGNRLADPQRHRR